MSSINLRPPLATLAVGAGLLAVARRVMRLRNRAFVAAGLLLAGMAAIADSASSAPSARVNANGTLVLEGTPARDDITMRVRSDQPNRLEIDLGDDGSADLLFAKRDFDRIRVRARGGNDRVRIDDSPGAVHDRGADADRG